MAEIDKKLSEVTAATLPLAGSELAYVVQGGNERRTTAAAIAATLPDATTSTAGKLSAADKARLDQLGADDSPSFAGLTITGPNAVVIPHIHGDVAGTLYFHVKNVSGGPLTKGTPVSVVGAVGNTTTLEVEATNPAVVGVTQAHGLLYADLADNDSGHAVLLGELQEIDTSAYAPSTVQWVGASGGRTGTRPASGAQQVATVGRQHATTGTLLVAIQGVEPTPAQIGAADATTASAALAAINTRLDRFRDARTFYVSRRVGAADTNNGTSPGEPFLTIGAAVAAVNAYRAANPTEFATIEIGPGTYIESLLPMRLASNVLVRSIKQRCVRVKPAAGQELNSFFAVDSGCMICDLTFAGHQAQNTSPTDSTVGTRAWAIQFNELANGGTGVFLTASPYIKDCLSITAEDDAGEAGSTSTGDCGGGVEVDGAKCAPNSPVRSMVVYGFTQQNLGGPGIIVKNDAYAELVSFFGLFGTWHVRAETGGQATMSGGGCSEFGTYGLMADGYSPTPIFTGALLANAAQGATTVDVGNLSANRIGSASRPGPGQLLLLAGNVYVVQSATPITGGYRVAFYSPTSVGLAAAASTGAAVNFRLRSQISAGCHTMNYVGSGTNYSALPQNGGVPIRANETVETNYGRIFGATVNDVGDFKIAGGAFAVDGTTGAVTISTTSFNLSGLNAVGPFSRNGGISTVGVQLQEVSNNVNLLASTGVSDGNTAPAQFAVRSFATSRFLQGLTVTAGQPITLSDTSTTDGDGFQVRNRNIALSLNSPNGLARLDAGGLVPASLLPNLVEIGVACSDETTALTTGTAKATFRLPYAMTLTAVRASVTVAPTGSTLIVDINEDGSSILGTKLSIDATEKTSVTATTPAVISDSILADDAEITVDIDQIGATVAGAGLKVWLIGRRA